MPGIEEGAPESLGDEIHSLMFKSFKDHLVKTIKDRYHRNLHTFHPKESTVSIAHFDSRVFDNLPLLAFPRFRH